MTNLEKLAALAKYGLTIEINSHRTCHEPILSAIGDYEATNNEKLPADLKKEMVDFDSFVWITCYPHSSGGSIDVIHWDINVAIDECIKACHDL